MLTHLSTERDAGDVVRCYLHPTLGVVYAGVVQGENVIRVVLERRHRDLMANAVRMIGTPEWEAEMAAVRSRVAARANAGLVDIQPAKGA